MKKIASIVEYFDTSLLEIKTKKYTKLVELQRKIDLSYDCLSQLRVIVRDYGFSTKDEEIDFFKNQKPYILGRLYYYKKLDLYLIKQPFSSIEQQVEYINNELNDLDTENFAQLRMLKYLRLKETNLDHYFFLRSNNQLDIFTETSHHIEDPDFYTNHDYVVSEIITNKFLRKYYSKELDILKNKEVNNDLEGIRPVDFKGLNWTGNKIQLGEVAISLCESQSLNNGNAELTKVAKALEWIFNVDLGNIHKISDRIRSRGKDQAKFLDSLKNGLINKLNKI